MIAVAAWYAAYLPWVEAEMRDAASRNLQWLRHYAMMQYHMGWLDDGPRAAWRRRPASACGRSCACWRAPRSAAIRRAVPAAAGLELLHNFSLIHDDIEDHSAHASASPDRVEAVRDASGLQRRRRHVQPGPCAFHRLEEAISFRPLPWTRCGLLTRCVRLTEASTWTCRLRAGVGVIRGVLPDDRRQDGRPTGCQPADRRPDRRASPELANAYRRYGAALGRAFQLRDDVLGIWGDEAVTGKSAASDILSKKKSLPIIYALQDPTVARPQLAQLYASPG